MKSFSISLKLAAWYACSLLLGLAVFGVGMRFVLADSMLSWKDRTLQMRAGRVEAVLRASNTRPTLEATDARLGELLSILPEGEWIELARNDGARVFPRGPAPPGMPVLPFVPCPVPGLRDRLVGREHFRQLCRSVPYAGQPATLLVLSPLDEDRILLRNFTLALYRLVPLVLVVSVLGGYVLGRRALRPVDLLIIEARSVTAMDLSRRLSVPEADDQIRTLALAWNDLLARMEAAMIRITQFTADASHELRNPIAYIRAAAEYNLTNAGVDRESRDTFRAIAEEAALTGELLENLLILAHPHAQLSPMEPEPVNVSGIISGTVQHFAAAARKKNQTLCAAAPNPELTLRINPLHLRRVLTAVLDNALKYTPDGGWISVEYESANGFVLRVTDNGIGIAREHLPRVFDRFFRVDAVRSDGSEGVGLGLPIAKWLTERYGGTIGVESELGRGTTVTIAFPERMVVTSQALPAGAHVPC